MGLGSATRRPVVMIMIRLDEIGTREPMGTYLSVAPPKTFMAFSNALRMVVGAFWTALTICWPWSAVRFDSVIASKIAVAVSLLMFWRMAGEVARSSASALLIPELMMSSTLFWI